MFVANDKILLGWSEGYGGLSWYLLVASSILSLIWGRSNIGYRLSELPLHLLLLHFELNALSRLQELVETVEQYFRLLQFESPGSIFENADALFDDLLVFPDEGVFHSIWIELQSVNFAIVVVMLITIGG